MLADEPEDELLPALLLCEEDGARPLEKSGKPGIDADAPDCRAPGDGIEGMPAEEPRDADDEPDEDELDDEELDEDELDEELELELEEELELDDELELDGDGMDGIDDDGIDGICGMLDCVC